MDNYGRPDVGRWRLNGNVDVADLSGYGDKLSADVTHTESNETNFGSLSYSLPLGPAGGRLNASYNQSEYRVGKLFTPLGLSGSSRNANLSYLYPEIRSHQASLVWGLGFEHEGGDSFTDPESSKPSAAVKKTATTSSNLNLLQLTGFYTAAQDDGSSYSLNGTFASNGHRDDGTVSSAERARVELDAGYAKPLGTSLWSLSAKAAGEWSPDPLADVEKYSLGGPDNVRGFPSADVRGDSAMFGSVELQRSFAPTWPLALGWYVDAGKAWSKQFSSRPLGCKPNFSTKPPQTCSVDGDAEGISSVGTELIFQSPGKRWESRLEWAYAVGRKPSDGNSGGHIWATFGMNF
jgi:hemolysin activation/secretion protein